MRRHLQNVLILFVYVFQHLTVLGAPGSIIIKLLSTLSIFCLFSVSHVIMLPGHVPVPAMWKRKLLLGILLPHLELEQCKYLEVNFPFI